MFLKKHWISIGIVTAFLLVCVGFVIWADHQEKVESAKIIEKSRLDGQALEKAVQKQLAAIAKAKAIEKAKAEAEAAKAAEQKKVFAASGMPAASAPSRACLVASGHSDPSSISVMVNKRHCLQPLQFTPGDLMTVNGATISAKASADFAALMNAAAAAGVPLSVTSSYRSYSAQVATYNHWVAVNGSVAAADTVSARAGFSEHQTGFTVDLAAGGCGLECFAGTQQYVWMQNNAASFGFIERYKAGQTGITGYSPEPWHYRFVGKAVAMDMQAKGASTLENYWGLQGGGY